MIEPNILISTLHAIRAKNPLILNITNQVATQFTANILLGLGASPAMANAEEEVEEFVQKSNALVINIGTLSTPQLRSMQLASRTAYQQNIPWILDPVGISASLYRAKTTLSLLQNFPNAIRGNASEIISLYHYHQNTSPRTQGHGVDSLDSSHDALEAAKQLALSYKTTVSISGQTDYITNGKESVSVRNSHPLLTKVTGSGCAATAITAACLSVEKNTLYACSAAMAFIGIAADIAMQHINAPGSLQIGLIDELYLLNDEKIIKYAKINLVK